MRGKVILFVKEKVWRLGFCFLKGDGQSLPANQGSWQSTVTGWRKASDVRGWSADGAWCALLFCACPREGECFRAPLMEPTPEKGLS